MNDYGSKYKGTPTLEDDSPTLWRDMTPEEKGALLLAAHEGKVIECKMDTGDWYALCNPAFASKENAYRIKPSSDSYAVLEPKVETVTAYAQPELGGGFEVNSFCDHWEWAITFNLIDVKPDCDSIKMEEL